jgi:hypothetical protein
MPVVVFAFGSRPGLGMSEYDALELARLLELPRSLAGINAAGKIKAEAKRGRERLESSEVRDVELDADELKALAAVLAQEMWPQQQSWFGHLGTEVMHACVRASDATRGLNT